MKTARTLLAVVVGAGLSMASAPPVLGADEFCPMGGTLIKVEVDKDKAIAWAKDQRKVAIADEGADTWSVLALSRTDDDIAILIKSGSVFFGVAGKGREVEESDIIKAFGNDLRNLREAVQKDMGDLRKEDVVKIEGRDVQPLADAAGLGVLEKGRDGWELKTEKCDGVSLDASGL